MRRYIPPYYSPPRRGYGYRGRSPPRRGYGSGHDRRKGRSHGSLLVRNIPLDCRPDELRIPFERFGPVRDVYIPRDYYSGEPRGFAFVEFVDPYDAAEAQRFMNGRIFAGRGITVVMAAESRKRPEEMRARARPSGPSEYRGRPYYGRSYSRSISHSRSPRHPSGPSSRYRSRSYSPARSRKGDRSPSPRRKPEEYHDARRGQDGNENYEGRVYSSPGLDDGKHHNRVSRSPSGSRSRSADLSPRPSR